jgi:hypothetical protein
MQTTSETEMREAGSSPAPCSAFVEWLNASPWAGAGKDAGELAHAAWEAAIAKDERSKLAKAAISHVLNAIADDPRKFWLMGDMTGSQEKLTAAAAALWNMPQEKIKADFRPRKDKWEQYCEEHEANEKLLRYCRDHGIKAE